MAITLTCPCGHQQVVANTLSSQTVACGACGNALKVPAMGILASPKVIPRRAEKPAPVKSPRLLGVMLLAASVFLLLSSGVGLLAWSMTRETLVEPPPIAQKTRPEPIERERAETPPIERKRPEPVKREPAKEIEPEAPMPKDPPKRVIEPVEPPTRIGLPVEPTIEPVKQVGELPNPFGMLVVVPVKPKEKEPAPKVVEKKPINGIEPIKLVWKLKAGDVFFQELVVTQKPSFKVLGIPIAMGLQYHIVSRFTVQKANADGSLVVEQKVVSAKLLQADDLTRPAVAGAIGQMPGTTFTLHLSPTMDVMKFEGGGPGPKVGAMQFNGGAGVQMTSLVDRDGWKELAQVTFFQMNEPHKPGARWAKPMTHNWGALGSWAGQIQYLYAGQKKDLHHVNYGLNLVYRAPGATGVGMLKINGANFQPPQAGGTLVFDAARGKVVVAEERFRVRGLINTNLLGQATPIEIDEDQHFLIRIHDKMNP